MTSPGGAGSKCFRILQRNGFDVVPKPSEFAPTAETLLLEVRTKEALQAPSIPRPTGQVKPGKVNRETVAYERDPLVIAFVLRRAAGKCECCGEDAPFRNVWGMPFLEVHHIRSLSVGGADTVENTAALCPNCHRECHYGENASALQQRLTTMAELSSGEQLR